MHIEELHRVVVQGLSIGTLGCALLLAATACGKSGAGSNDAGEDYGQPICILQDGGSYACTGGEREPACSPSAQTGQPCSGPPFCMGCDNPGPNQPGAGYYCQCEDAGVVPDQDGALLWECIGTEHLCR